MALLARYARMNPDQLPADAKFFWLETDAETLVVVSFQESQVDRSAEDPSGKLSPAELSVLQYLAAGHSDLAIARALRKSPRTVAHQVGSIFRKLGVASRRELLAALRSAPIALQKPARSRRGP